MLEAIRRPWWHAPLVEQFRLHELPEALLQRGGIQRRHGLEQVIRKRPPQRRSQLGHRFHPTQVIQARHQRIMERGGNGQRG